MNSNRKLVRTVSILAAGAVIAQSASSVSAATLDDISSTAGKKAAVTASASSTAVSGVSLKLSDLVAAQTSDSDEASSNASGVLSGVSLKLAGILADSSDSTLGTEANETDTVAASDDASADTDTEEAQDPYASTGIVTVEGASLNVRSGPDTSTDIVGKLYHNNACTVVEDLGDWLHITSGNVDGYVAAEYVTVGDAQTCEAAQSHSATVNCDGLYVRSLPTTDSSVVELVTRDTVLSVTDLSTADQGWVAVTDGSASGYVSTDYVTLNTAYTYGETADEIAAREAAEAAARAAAEAEAAAKAAQAASAAKSSRASSSASTSTSSTTSSAAASSSSSSAASYSAPASQSGAAVASYAAQFIGNPYKYGGTSLTGGCDCSGFVLAVYAQFGVSLPHSSSADRSVGYAVSVSDMQAGDIVCYNGHVGIYAGNGTIINATTPSGGIAYTNVNYKPIVAVRRIF